MSHSRRAIYEYHLDNPPFLSNQSQSPFTHSDSSTSFYDLTTDHEYAAWLRAEEQALLHEEPQIVSLAEYVRGRKEKENKTELQRITFRCQLESWRLTRDWYVRKMVEERRVCVRRFLRGVGGEVVGKRDVVNGGRGDGGRRKREGERMGEGKKRGYRESEELRCWLERYGSERRSERDGWAEEDKMFSDGGSSRGSFSNLVHRQKALEEL